jgi:hypothetical protein
VDLENLNSTIRRRKPRTTRRNWAKASGTGCRARVAGEAVRRGNAARYSGADGYRRSWPATLRGIKILDHRQRHVRHITGLRTICPLRCASMDGLAVVQPMFRDGEMSLIQMGDRWPRAAFHEGCRPHEDDHRGQHQPDRAARFGSARRPTSSSMRSPGLKMTGRAYSMAAWPQRLAPELPSGACRCVDIRAPTKLIPDLSASAGGDLASVDNATPVPLAPSSPRRARMWWRAGRQAGLRSARSNWANANNTHVSSSPAGSGRRVAVEEAGDCTAAMASL